MIGEPSSFFQLSKTIAEDFLQTVVIIDDLVGYEEKPQEKPVSLKSPKIRPGLEIEGIETIKESSQTIQQPEIQPETKIEETGTPKEVSQPEGHAQPQKVGESLLDNQSDQSQPPAKTIASSEGQTENAHYLNAKKVIDSFAEKGIVCSILRPTKEEMDTLPGKFAKLASCADIVIIDWELHQDNGETAKQILKGVACSSLGHPAQLRLIMFYTGSQDIAGISAAIKTCLTGILEFKVNTEDNDCTLRLGPNRIVVYAKPDTKVPDPYKSRIVPFEALAECVTNEFTKMTAGLVSNVVIASLAKIRQNTHKILSRFSSDLDAPYLTHRALLLNPDEAEDHLTLLIAEELRAILEETDIGNNANLEAIRACLNDKTFEFKFDEDISFTKEEVISLLQIGVGKWVEEWMGFKLTNSSFKKLRKEEDFNGILEELKSREIDDFLIKREFLAYYKDLTGGRQAIESLILKHAENFSKLSSSKAHRSNLTGMFQPDYPEPQQLDEKFAFITTVRPSYKKPVSKLTLGTILKQETSECSTYWVCIHPRCDCVRLDSETAFLFLPLQPQINKEEKFDVIIEEGEQYVRLLLCEKPSMLNVIRFLPDPVQKRIIAISEGDSHHFSDTDGKKYRWIGDLRSEHAQRISNRFAATLSRVGVDESEWLRRWTEKR